MSPRPLGNERTQRRSARKDAMKASETTVRKILQGEKHYVVPLYQRRHS
jgi:hypothetical protein